MKVDNHLFRGPPRERSSIFRIDWDVELDTYVSRMEQAYLGRSDKTQSLDILNFIPPRDHPRFEEIAKELVRVDIELSASDGSLRGQEYYRQRLGTLVDQSCFQEGIAIERDRLGRNAADLLSSQNRESAFPEVGDEVCGFYLLRELGRGSFGRVYLASERELSHRKVVLKMSTQFPGEAQILSKLVHRNIVPIYSLHQKENLHLVCMPMLGATTLHDLLQELKAKDQAPVSGIALMDTIRKCSSQTWEAGNGIDPSISSSAIESCEPARAVNDKLLNRLEKEFQQQSYANSVLWLVSQLAEGLVHAHERNVLHRDIKPANVLISDDGVPMLLDFNLASDPSAAGSFQSVVGGTPRYMAPEQLEEVRSGKIACDGRADIYSMGLILYELLTLRYPFPNRTGNSSAQLQRMIDDRAIFSANHLPINANWTSGVVSIIHQSLKFRPDERYQTVQEFLLDLKCELSHEPLRHATGERRGDRIRKWNRRHPRLSSGTMVACLAGTMLILAASAMLVQKNRIYRMQSLDWLEQARHSSSTALGLMSPGGMPTEHIQELIRRCDETLAGYDDLSRRNLADWEAADADELASQLFFLRARGLASLACLQADTVHSRRLLEMSARDAESARGLSEKLSPLAKILGESVHSALDLPHDTAFPHAIQRALSTGRRPMNEMIDSMKSAITTDASNVWYWTNLAQLQLEEGQRQAAESNLLVACSLDQNLLWPRLLLGTSRLDSSRFKEARDVLDQVIQRDSRSVTALLNRALASIGLGNWQSALDDLNLIVDHADSNPRILFVRSLVYKRMGRISDAIHDRDVGLSLRPHDARSWNARGEVLLQLSPPDPDGALEAFRQASAIFPSLRNSYENMAHVLSEHLGRTTEAIEALDHAIACDQDYALAWSSRGVLNARLGNVERALSDARHALDLDPSPIVIYQAASVFALVRRNDEDEQQALRLLKKTARLNPALAKLMQEDSDLAKLQDRKAISDLIAAAIKLN